MSAKLFGRGEEDTTTTPATTTSPDATSDATFNIRGWAGVMCVGGVLMCFVPPVTPLCPGEDVCFISRVYLPMVSDGIELSYVGPVVVGDGPDVPAPTVAP